MAPRKLTDKQRNFIAKYIDDKKRYADPKAVGERRHVLHKRLRRQRRNTRHRADEAIHTRKQLAQLERFKYMSQLAALTAASRQDILSDRKDPFAKAVMQIYVDFGKRIDGVSESRLRYEEARAQIKEIEAEMRKRFASLMHEVKMLQYQSSSAELADIAQGKAVVVWERDFGTAIRQELGTALKFLTIADAPISLVLEDKFLTLLEEDKDFITPAAMVDEVEEVFRLSTTLAKDRIVASMQEATERAQQEASDQNFDTESDASDYVEFLLQQHINTQLQPIIADISQKMREDMDTYVEMRWAQVVHRRNNLKWRPLKKVLRIGLPVLGITVGILGIIGGVTGGVVSAPTIAGPVAAAGVVFASITIIRSSMSLLKNAHLQWEAIETLSGSLRSDLENLAKRYEKGHTGAQEVGTVILHAVTVVPVIETLPTVTAKFEELEMRVAAKMEINRKLHAKVEEAIAENAKERERIARILKVSGNELQRFDRSISEAGKQATALLEEITKSAEKVRSFQTMFGRFRAKLNELSELVSSGVKKATTIIPIVTDLVLLIAAAGVGVAGVEAATEHAEAVSGSFFTLMGEVIDGANLVIGETET